LILLLDNFDSFTYNLVDYFAQLNVPCDVVRNDTPFEEISGKRYRGIVLSPGPGGPNEAGCLIQVLERFHNTVPILGICLGHQAIGCFFGAKLVKAEKPMHGKLSKVQIEDSALFYGLGKSLNVVRYHSLVLSELPDSLKPIALAENNEIMAIEHWLYPIAGVQFHPEAILTDSGIKMLENWIKFHHLLD
jgi:anthranilate synthase/aminodeoxychorismate synthase-like glutamine amidotransferase